MSLVENLKIPTPCSGTGQTCSLDRPAGGLLPAASRRRAAVNAEIDHGGRIGPRWWVVFNGAVKPSPGGLFASTVPYYARFRPAYDPRLFALLGRRFSLDGSQRVLDLGAGSGALTLPLAPLLRTVIAVDPEPAMLAEGRRLAARAGVSGIDWRLGSSDTLLAVDVGPVLLTVMGASFHWTDRERLLRDLDVLIEPGARWYWRPAAPGTTTSNRRPGCAWSRRSAFGIWTRNACGDPGRPGTPTCVTRRFCSARRSAGSRRSTGTGRSAAAWTRSLVFSSPTASPARPHSAPTGRPSSMISIRNGERVAVRAPAARTLQRYGPLVSVRLSRAQGFGG
ncbi:class I SAM-dependent methyltransferase [Kitasatospora sp. NPDC054795]